MKKVLFICSTGGHLSEMMKLSPLFDEYQSMLVTEKDETTKNRQFPIQTKFLVFGTRKHLISYLFKFSYNIIKSLIYFIQFKPDAIITTGAHTCFPMVMIASLFKKQIIFIESIARVNSPSLTGTLIRKHCTHIIVQWEEMLKVYPEATYGGQIL